MSEATLKSLLEYLYGTLSPSNMRWVGMHLIEQADAEELKPYTVEELHEMIERGEKQIADGLCQDSEDVFRELEEELAMEEQKMEYAEAV